MHHIYSKLEPKKLLHLINRVEEITARTNVAPDEQFLQLATLRMAKGTSFKPHKHIWKLSPTKDVIAQESWVVIKGSVKVFFYDTDGQLLEVQIINQGDCSMTFQGGQKREIWRVDRGQHQTKAALTQELVKYKDFI